MENPVVEHPQWCCGDHTDDGLHASEWDGWSGDEVGHLLARSVGEDGDHVEIALYAEADDAEAVIRVSAAQAYELLGELTQAVGFPIESLLPQSSGQY